MNISQKCQYALRSVFELAKRQGQGYISTSAIAETQAIPRRFLEQILTQLKQTDYVEARRGAGGGYALAVSPSTLKVGDIIRFIEGPLDPVSCIGADGSRDCPLFGNCAFVTLWARARDAVSAVYDNTTFQDLINEERAKQEGERLNYCI